MSLEIPLSAYTDQTITDSTPVRAVHISEPRNNVQLCLTTLDKHIGTRGATAHGNVSHENPGFMTPALLALIDSYNAQLNDLAAQLADDEIPTYVIAIWHGEANQVPTGWKTCDGTGGTPDLRSRVPVNWGSSHVLSATGGSMAKAIDLDSLFRAHTHKFSNCTFLCGGATSPYSRYTKYGTVYGDQWYWDWDNCTKALKETSGSAGSGSSSSFSVTIRPPYVAKWYIQKQPTDNSESAVPTFMINVTQPEHGTITTNVGGRVTRGTRLVISVTANSGYLVDKIYVNDEEVANDIIMYVYEDTNITATFKEFPYISTSYTTAGTYSWTAPANVSVIQVELAGAGGGGGGYARNVIGSNAIGGTGGRGALTSGRVEVIPGGTYTLTVGAGGTAGVGAMVSSRDDQAFAGDGGTGGTTTAFGLSARGGGGGTGGTSSMKPWGDGSGKPARHGTNGTSYGNGAYGGGTGSKGTGATLNGKPGNPGWIKIEYGGTIR